MKKMLYIILLVFSGLALIEQIIYNFEDIKATYYTLNFKRHFEVKRFYYISNRPGYANKSSKDLVTIIGRLENSKNERRLSNQSEANFRKFLKNDTERDNAIYFDVWHSKELDMIHLKTNERGFFAYPGLLKVIMWIFSIPAIIYLIKNRK